MDFNEYIEKIKEWENDRDKCDTSTMKGLVQKVINAGICIINNLSELIYVFTKNADTFNQCSQSLQEILVTKNIDIYVSLCGEDTEQITNEIKKEFENDEEKLRNSKEVKDILESWKGLSIDEIIKHCDDLLEEVNCHNELVNQKIFEGIELQKNALSYLFYVDSLFFLGCFNLIEGAFNYHDYGQWEKIKEGIWDEIKSNLLGINIFFSIIRKNCKYSKSV